MFVFFQNLWWCCGFCICWSIWLLPQLLLLLSQFIKNTALMGSSELWSRFVIFRKTWRMQGPPLLDFFSLIRILFSVLARSSWCGWFAAFHTEWRSPEVYQKSERTGQHIFNRKATVGVVTWKGSVKQFHFHSSSNGLWQDRAETSIRWLSVKTEDPPSRDHVIPSCDIVIPITWSGSPPSRLTPLQADPPWGGPHDDTYMTPSGRPGLQPRSAQNSGESTSWSASETRWAKVSDWIHCRCTAHCRHPSGRNTGRNEQTERGRTKCWRWKDVCLCLHWR